MNQSSPVSSAPCGHFPRRWEATILDGRPLILPSRHYTYPRIAEEVERGAMEVLVTPAGGSSFLATCALGFADPIAPSALWTHPSPAMLCAVAGGYAYLIDTASPEHCEQISYRPVLAVHAAEHLLFFVGSCGILAYGAQGLVWEASRLSDEGLTIVGFTGSTLQAVGWSLKDDSDVNITLELATGRRLA